MTMRAIDENVFNEKQKQAAHSYRMCITEQRFRRIEFSDHDIKFIMQNYLWAAWGFRRLKDALTDELHIDETRALKWTYVAIAEGYDRPESYPELTAQGGRVCSSPA